MGGTQVILRGWVFVVGAENEFLFKSYQLSDLFQLKFLVPHGMFTRIVLDGGFYFFLAVHEPRKRILLAPSVEILQECGLANLDFEIILQV